MAECALSCEHHYHRRKLTEKQVAGRGCAEVTYSYELDNYSKRGLKHTICSSAYIAMVFRSAWSTLSQ